MMTITSPRHIRLIRELLFLKLPEAENSYQLSVRFGSFLEQAEARLKVNEITRLIEACNYHLSKPENQA